MSYHSRCLITSLSMASLALLLTSTAFGIRTVPFSNDLKTVLDSCHHCLEFLVATLIKVLHSLFCTYDSRIANFQSI